MGCASAWRQSTAATTMPWTQRLEWRPVFSGWRPCGLPSTGMELRPTNEEARQAGARTCGILWRESETRDRADSSNNRHDAEDKHCCSRDACDDGACRSELLDQNETGQRCDPDEVHDSHHKEHAHQRPATTEAVGAVPEAHQE